MAAPVAEANTTSQMFGKALGLSNYASSKTDAIMSNPKTGFNVEVWKHTSLPSGSNQDDFAIISNSTNTFGVAPDDHGNTLATATVLTASNNAYTTADD